jgi:hypothetical protein
LTTVSLDQLLQYSLGRQGLLQRDSAGDYGPLHCTDHTTPYLSLLARVEAFDWAAFATHLYDHKAWSRLRCMRGTIHLIPAEQARMVACAYNLRETENFQEFAEYDIPFEEAVEVRFYIMELLREHESVSTLTLKKLLDPDLINTYRNNYGGSTTTIGPALRWLWSLGLLESGTGVKGWRRKDNTFRLADNPPADCDDEARAAADLDLCRWYFDLYAPVAFEDWAWWAGLVMERSRRAFDTLRAELEPVKVMGIREELWMPPGQIDALTAADDSPPEMVRLLPYEDALIKAYKATRYRFFDADGLAEDIAFTKGGEAVPTMWLDGRIVGIWEWARKANEPMTVEPFLQPTKAFRKRFTPEVARVRSFIESSHVLWSS